MPAISSGKVLVSGANGFIAAWVVRALLEEGFAVRGAVRSVEKGAHLREVFASYDDRFELVVVPDIAKEGAFDEAVQGVDAIEHTASPFHLQADDPEVELIRPAIHGTVGILQSALKHGKAVKRVVVTSSCAAVLQVEKEPKTFSELDWNEQAPKEVAEMGRAASAITKYRASKTLAERAAWDFVEKHKSEIGWDLVVINPPFVFGPTIHHTATPDALNTSARQFYTMLTEESSPAVRHSGSCWVDVRDLGRAHVLALLRAEAGGERIIVSAGPFVWQDWLDAAPDSPKYQKGVPGAGKDAVHQIRYDASKSARVLGMTAYRTMAETARDSAADWEARGW
ncbi:D-lactaldehyde dehydrogenase [Mycena venus]|uniref:D-lactaldehyde dehydrogenase n=1 Tax=Mycena venus TaxID=2733690 RepID=A0A8H7DET8_9AGAR|nr:D-lactaldehyde dehydrogenase [Mycena venus]